MLGSTSAQVKIIVYSDFACSFCVQFKESLGRIKNDFGEQVAIAFRHFPLNDVSLDAANASECAAEQGKFWEMHDLLFEDNKSGRLSKEQSKLDAISLGLDQEKFNQCLDGQKYNEKIVAAQEEAKSFNVNGTPTTFVNGEIVIGATPYEDVTAEDGQKIEGLKNIISRHLNDK
ncbi:MAG: Periplasmic thiol:disulfide interchange protein DsbA [Parcubacteria group bacterium GW2011_GWE2_39_37]|nr:MAG: Periplasmic thiol:disulfide interchange protein DsbA [Parcubacteria group bacterium GW2011_GWE2_39_37]